MTGFVKHTSIILSTLLLISCLVTEDSDRTVSGYNSKISSSESSSSSITSVSITAPSLMQSGKSALLIAVVSTSGTSTVTCSWEISQGSTYASLSDSQGESVTLTGANETSTSKDVIVTLSATDGATTKTASATISIAPAGTEVQDEITALVISTSSSSISAKGSATLTAIPSYTGSINPLTNITYTWEILEGRDYAALSGSTSSSETLTGTNTTTQSHTVSLAVTAWYESSSLTSDTLSITVKEKAVVSSSYNTQSTVDTSLYSKVLYLDMGNALISCNNNDWEEISTDALTFFDDTVKVKFTEDSNDASTGLIRINGKSISGDLALYISGTNNTSLSGGVKIQSNASDTVAVYVQDAVLTSTNYPCIEITKGSPSIVTLSGTNSFTDGRVYGTGYGEEYATSSGETYTDDDGNTVTCTVSKTVVEEGSDGKGTLYSKGDLTVKGSGSLSVSQSYKNCIASKGTLTIESGSYSLKSSGKSGLHGDASVVINGGEITFNGEGAISGSGSSTAATFRKVNGIKTDTDDSSSAVYINGGTLNITAYNGKGINASKVYITGGTNTLNVTGITSYTNDANKSGFYYDADGVRTPSSGTMTLTFAAEGIEGASLVEVSGGQTELSATDDGINVSNSSGAFYMKDGLLYSKSTGGDGIDANGNLYLQGGMVISYAPTGSEDSFDSGSKIYLTGGVIAGISGSSMALGEYTTSGSQKMLYFSGSSSSGSGKTGPGASSSTSSSSFSKVAVAVSGTIQYAFTLPSSSFGLFVMSDPSFTGSSTSSYTVYTSPSFSGGTSFNGLYSTSNSQTTLPTVTTGSSTSTPSIK